MFVYEWARTLAHRVNPDAFYRPQLDADRVIGLGTTPTARLQGWLFDGHLRWHDHALIFLHSLHFAVPLALLFAVWLTCRPFFIQAAAALLATSFAAALVFLVFPAAPPWLAVRAGLLHGVVRIRALDEAQGAHGTLQASVRRQPRRRGSLPARGLLAARRFDRVADVATPDATGDRLRHAMHFSVVYLGEHYVSDLIAGDALALVAWWAVGRSRFAVRQREDDGRAAVARSPAPVA